MKNKALIVPFFLLMTFLGSSSIYGQIVDVKKAPGEADEREEVDYDLTDQERYESQQFVHEGLLQRQIKENCDKLKDSKACRGGGKTEFMGVDSNMVQAVAKMYSLFGGMIGATGDAMDFKGKSSTDKESTDDSSQNADDNQADNSQNGEQTQGEENNSGDKGDKEEGGKKKNYCVYIPAAGETIAMFMQQMGQDNIMNQASTETPQKDMLYKAARSHETRAKTAKMQGTVWGATTACYAAYMATGGISMDWKFLLQAGAAGFLTIFWFNEAKQHEKYAEEVRKIADNLPGKGDCNPHTQKDCYCAQPETQYDPTHCLPELHKKAVANTSFRVPCVDKDMKADAQCDCVTKEACFDTEFFSDISAPGFVQFGQSSAGKDFKKLTRGELVNGKLGAGSNGNSVAAKRLLGDLAKKVDGNKPLSKSDLSVSDAMEGMGMPPSLARAIAAQPTTAEGRRRAAGVTSGSTSRARVTSSSGNRNGVLRFSGGTGRIGAQKKNSGPNFKSMLNKMKKKKGGSNQKYLKFANKAQNQAQIENNKDKALFEIISRRYQVSGWRRLEIQ